MEKKSSVKDVYKLVQQDYPALYKKIAGVLGDDNPFAKFSIGAGTYIWSDTRCEWHQMIAESAPKQDEVKQAVGSVRSMLCSKFGAQQTELLLTIPDDGYIYFNEDSGSMKILITGWGFKKPVRHGGGPIIDGIKEKKKITIAFVYDGAKIPDYPFELSFAQHRKKLVTDANGLFQMDASGKEGRYTVYDVQDSHKSYPLDIVPEQTYYEIDVTKYAVLEVDAVADGRPVVNEQVDIDYHGKTLHMATDGTGHASIDLPLYENEELTARLRDELKRMAIHASGNHIDFVFTTPPPVMETDVVVSVMFDGHACPNKEVAVEYQGQTYTGKTDENGCYVKHLQVGEGEICRVAVEEYPPQQKALENTAVNEFRFEKNTPPPPPPAKVTPKIVVKRENGDLVADYPLTVEADGKTGQHVTDAHGEVALPEMPEQEKLTVTDGNDPSHQETYTVTVEQQECVFIIPNEEPTEEPPLKLMFRDKDGKPISPCRVLLRQEGQADVSVSLDDKGEVCLPKDTFKTGEKITATLDALNNSYSPIPFTTEEGEYEYLLQEKMADKSKWLLLAQVLLVLATAAAMIFLWPYLEGVCSGLYEGVYDVPCPYSPR